MKKLISSCSLATAILLTLMTPGFSHDRTVLSLDHVVYLSERIDRHDKDLVRSIQRSLRAHGLYHGAIDGLAGPKTVRGLNNAKKLLSPWIVPVIRMDLDGIWRPGQQPYKRVYRIPSGSYPHIGYPIQSPSAPWQLPYPGISYN
ncbi:MULTISPECIES: peptidoglycan-binding domain-containing protein [Roseinatronobacter]|uniref:Peptidoglycan binding-like domain-containing protein n=1 Tax=Roseinatronobacter domitianus TaxID=2940293 RepID=A0ABT0M5D3_9RHOB|nr:MULTISPECIES: hypothetical protein [Roseibaca]MCL1630066.1 hypothetical protein [Roseibaca domitiana]